MISGSSHIVLYNSLDEVAVAIFSKQSFISFRPSCSSVSMFDTKCEMISLLEMKLRKENTFLVFNKIK